VQSQIGKRQPPVSEFPRLSDVYWRLHLISNRDRKIFVAGIAESKKNLTSFTDIQVDRNFSF